MEGLRGSHAVYPIDARSNIFRLFSEGGALIAKGHAGLHDMRGILV